MIPRFKLADWLPDMSVAVGFAIATMVALGTVNVIVAKAETTSSIQAAVADALAKNRAGCCAVRGQRVGKWAKRG